MTVPNKLDLIEFICHSNEAKTASELKDTFLLFLQSYGMDRFIMGQISHDCTSKKESHMDLLANYPMEWIDYYKNNHYVDHDPVYQTALVAKRPFTWKEIVQRTDLTLKARKVMNEAQENKLYNGVGLSIYRPFGEIIGMGLSSSEKNLNCDKNTMHVLYAAANQFFIAYSDLIGVDDPANVNIVQLTLREREVLLWLTRGKTRAEIASILDVTESAIKRHTETIFRKLNVNSIQLAIAKAIRAGLIHAF